MPEKKLYKASMEFIGRHNIEFYAENDQKARQIYNNRFYEKPDEHKHDLAEECISFGLYRDEDDEELSTWCNSGQHVPEESNTWTDIPWNCPKCNN